MSRALLLVLLIASVATAHAEAVEPAMACRKAAPSTKLSVMFSPETSVQDLAVWVMGFTCKNVVFSADVPKRATKITVLAPNAMTPKQAVQLFVHSLEAAGLTVVQKPDTFIVKLGPKLPKSCPDVAETASKSEPPRIKTPGLAVEEPAVDELEKEIDAGIRKIDDTHREITKALVDKVLANPMAIAKGARVVPAVKDGKPTGFKLYAIRPSSIYAKLGFANGDTIKTVNGFELTSADKALEVYTKLREASSLEIELDRRGKPVTLRFTIN